MALVTLLVAAPVSGAEQGKHLFILSGQSNMERLNPDESFRPTIVGKFGTDNVIVIKDSLGGQPIRRWYKNWKPAQGDEPKATGDLYDRLMNKVKAAIKDQNIKTVTFIWMQGERDARESLGDVYAASLAGLLGQLKNDMQRQDINFVIGRISDFDLDNKNYPHWTKVREAQVKFAESNKRYAWIDTDDLNDGVNQEGKEIKNDLHMSVEGYKTLGRRFAEKAIALIGNNPS